MKFSILTFFFITFLFVSCDNKIVKPTQIKINSADSRSLTNLLISDKMKTQFPISIVLLCPDDIHLREYFLISKDSLFNTIVPDSLYTDISFFEAYKSLWSTDKDWNINALLYSKYGKSNYDMKYYEPFQVEKWRKEMKSQDSIFWANNFKHVIYDIVLNKSEDKWFITTWNELGFQFLLLGLE